MEKNWSVINLNKKYFLRVGKKVFRCQIGQEGLKKAEEKVEGDETTPTGKWYLESLYYRPDRVLRPKFKKKNALKINQIKKYCGWCDDVRSHFYNKYIKINNAQLCNLSYEKLWREDNVYDIIIQISHNTKPIIKNRGSAIFIHCSFEDLSTTAGCVALKKRDLLFLIKNIKNKTYIQI